MDSAFRKLDRMLKNQPFDDVSDMAVNPFAYARCMAEVENVVAVVSDLSRLTSRIFAGGFAERLGLDGYDEEESIWEKRILSLMPEEELTEKFVAELRFLHFVRRQPAKRRGRYHLASRLRFRGKDGEMVDVLHRMYYVYDAVSGAVRYAVCLYGPLTFGLAARSVVVDSVSGVTEELTPADDGRILSRREKQVLSLINKGKTSQEIADELNISRHTVSRHRQEILARLQVRNSVEACRLARSMSII